MLGDREAALERENVQLRAALAEMRAANANLLSVVDALQRRIKELERQLSKPGKNSKNSHQPPSSDKPGKLNKKNKKKASDRKPGGQPGRIFRTRARLAPTATETIRPDNCQHCSGELKAGQKVGEVVFQRIDIPEISISVTDFVCETIACPSCSGKTTGQTNLHGRARFIGPRLAATMATLSGRFHLSKRQVQEALSSILGIKIGLGSVSNVEQRVSQAVAPAYEEAVEAVQSSSVVNADETGWREGGWRTWLWGGATASLAAFQISHSRGADAARRLLSDDFSGVLISDRWGAYNWVDDENRQFCWAHLLRDFTGWEEAGGRGSSYGARLHALGQETIHLWRTSQLSDADLSSIGESISSNKDSIHDLLKRAQYYGSPEILRTAKRLLSQEDCLWLFLTRPGVEPTNNHAERILRQAVLWRKKCFGTASGLGSIFVARILTTVTSLRLQGRNIVDFLSDSIKSFEGQGEFPSLLPPAKTLTMS